MSSDRINELIGQARPLLLDAVSQEKNHPMNAVHKYTEGASLLFEARELMADHDSRKKNLTDRIESYVRRAEELKQQSMKTMEHKGRWPIAEDSVGNDYYTVFGWCINDSLTSVIVEDSYIREHYQILNFVHLCEILVKHAKSLKHITLITGPGNDGMSNQAVLANFDNLKASLLEKGVQLQVSIKQELHDREITFDNGYVITIGRGLDYFKNSGGKKYVLGSCDYSFRKCRETQVNIHKVK